MKEKKLQLSYTTQYGRCYCSTIEDALPSKTFKELRGKVDLILTSPPFPLKRKKKYGNFNGAEYIEWIGDLAVEFWGLLKPTGSIVIEIGNAWEPGKPSMSTVPTQALLRFLQSGRFTLCQEFVWFNNARLPGPAQWVNIERIRVKDSFTKIWWMSKSERPKANNKRVLVEYSDSMKRLLSTRKYNSGKRPSEHVIGKHSFFSKHRGAIPSNVLVGSNTNSSQVYYDYCRHHKLPIHPARMPSFVADFFIKLLTTKDDLVLDPFGGSNVTGASAEELGRNWITVEAKVEYVRGSRGRFKLRKAGS